MVNLNSKMNKHKIPYYKEKKKPRRLREATNKKKRINKVGRKLKYLISSIGEWQLPGHNAAANTILCVVGLVVVSFYFFSKE